MHRVWLGATLLFALSFGLEDSAPPPWGYDKPTEWADEHCKDATALQSPIFINKTTPLATHPHLRPVLLTTQCRFAVDSTTVLQESNYRTLEVRLPSNATSAHTPCSLIDQNSGQLYPFVRFHFHVGAEHEVEGRDADAEVHLVFQQGGNTLVVGVRLRASKSPSSVVSNFFRATLAAPFPHGGGSRTKGLLRDIGLDDVLPASDGSYVTYEGSLTTPPCSPHVRWIVFTAVQDISSTTLAAVKSALASYMPTTFEKFGNARPLQPQLGRPMFKFSDPTSTTINRWIVTQDEEDRIRATSLAFSDAVSISTGGSFVTRHAFGLCVAILCFATIGLFLRLRERPLEVGVSNAARDAATYGTMET